MCADRRLDLHARREIVAEQFGDAPHRQRATARRRDDLRSDHLAVTRTLQVLGGNQQVVLNARVVGDHVGDALVHVQASDDDAADALDDLDQNALGAVLEVTADDAHEDAVAVHQRTHLPRRQEHVIATGVRNQKAETVAMRLHAAGDQVHLGDGPVGAAAVLHQLPVAHHRLQPLGERLLLTDTRQLEVPDQIIERQRPVVITQAVDDQPPARHRLGVLRGLFIELGIALLPGLRTGVFVGFFTIGRFH
jgi:hypothetical protein